MVKYIKGWPGALENDVESSATYRFTILLIYRSHYANPSTAIIDSNAKKLHCEYPRADLGMQGPSDKRAFFVVIYHS